MRDGVIRVRRFDRGRRTSTAGDSTEALQRFHRGFTEVSQRLYRRHRRFRKTPRGIAGGPRGALP